MNLRDLEQIMRAAMAGKQGQFLPTAITISSISLPHPEQPALSSVNWRAALHAPTGLSTSTVYMQQPYLLWV